MNTLQKAYRSYEQHDYAQSLKLYTLELESKRQVLPRMIIQGAIASIQVKLCNYTEAYHILSGLLRRTEQEDFVRQYSHCNDAKVLTLKIYCNLLLIQLVNCEEDKVYQCVEAITEMIERNVQSQVGGCLLSAVMISLFGFSSFEEMHTYCNSIIAQVEQYTAGKRYGSINEKKFREDLLQHSGNVYCTLSLLEELSEQSLEGAHVLQEAALGIFKANKDYVMAAVSCRHLLHIGRHMNLPKRVMDGYAEELKALLDCDQIKGVPEETLFRNYEMKMKYASVMTKSLKEFEARANLNHHHTNNQWKKKAVIRNLHSLTTRNNQAQIAIVLEAIQHSNLDIIELMSQHQFVKKALAEYSTKLTRLTDILSGSFQSCFRAALQLLQLNAEQLKMRQQREAYNRIHPNLTTLDSSSIGSIIGDKKRVISKQEHRINHMPATISVPKVSFIQRIRQPVEGESLEKEHILQASLVRNNHSYESVPSKKSPIKSDYHAKPKSKKVIQNKFAEHKQQSPTLQPKWSLMDESPIVDKNVPATLGIDRILAPKEHSFWKFERKAPQPLGFKQQTDTSFLEQFYIGKASQAQQTETNRYTFAEVPPNRLEAPSTVIQASRGRNNQFNSLLQSSVLQSGVSPVTRSNKPRTQPRSELGWKKNPKQEEIEEEDIAELIGNPAFPAKAFFKGGKEQIKKVDLKDRLKSIHLARCISGQYVLKRHFSSDGGEERFLQLSRDHTRILWAIDQKKMLQGKSTEYLLGDIKGVIYGKHSATLSKESNRNLQPWKCFSLIMKKRTFDVYCSTEKDIEFWLPGISSCLSRVHTNPLYYDFRSKKERKARPRHQVNIEDDICKSTNMPHSFYSQGRVIWRRVLMRLQHKYIKIDKKRKHFHNANATAIILAAKARMGYESSSQLSVFNKMTRK